MEADTQAPMDFNVVTEPKEVLSQVPLVRAVADDHREEFGFLPLSAYEELAAKGQLWIAQTADAKRLIGYLIFGGSGYEAKVFQLYVDPEARGHGVGSALLGRLKQHAHRSHRQLIVARVASDLPANRFWERQGFYVINQVAGGRSSGRTINLRIFELPRASLVGNNEIASGLEWVQIPEADPLFSSPTYALDVNVVLDVTRNRLDADLAGRLFSAAFDGELRVCVSSEFLIEMRRHSDSFGDDPLLRFAERLPVLPELDKKTSSSLLTSLREVVFKDRSASSRRAKNDTSDLNHLAACIHHRIRGFVTRERAILRTSTELSERFGIQVLSPYDLMLPRGLDSTKSAYHSIQAGKVSITCVPYTDDQLAALDHFSRKLQVSSQYLSEILASGTSTRRRHRLLMHGNDRLIACVSFHEAPVTQRPTRLFLLVDEELPGAQTAVDHALGYLLGAIPNQRLVQCELLFAPSQILTRQTAQTVGFTKPFASDGGLVGLSKLAFRGVVTSRGWPRFSGEFQAITGTSLPTYCPGFGEATCTGVLLQRSSSTTKRAMDLFTFETLLSPLLIAVSGRPAVLVPIRDKQASELLPGVEVQGSLFRKEAIIRLERAYFARPSVAKLFRRGSIVVFYVSAASGGRGEAVGMARITSSGVSSPAQLNLGLLRQGVLSQDDLLSMTSSAPDIGYFTFDSFLSFPKVLSFRELKHIKCIGGANLVTSQRLSPTQFAAIIDCTIERGVS